MKRRESRAHVHPAWCAAAMLVLLTACADFGGPRSGTESGNPINPPAPPAQGTTDGPPVLATGTIGQVPTIGSSPNVPDSSKPEPEPPTPLPPTGGSTEMPPPDGEAASTAPPAPAVPATSGGPGTAPSPAIPTPVPSSGTTGNTGSGAASTGSMQTAPQATPVPPNASTDQPNTDGSSGAPSVSDDCASDVCFEQASAAASRLSQPQPASAVHTAAVCDAGICTCSRAAGSLTLSVDAPTCVVSGRFGECLFEPAEYLGCSAESGECADACDVLDARIDAEAASAPSVSVRLSACTATGCRYVLEGDLGCVVGPELSPRDCVQADAEVSAATN